MKLHLIATAAAAIIASPAAAATNLVTNGSFETGNFANWTQVGDTSFTAVVSGAFDCCSPTDGTFQAVFGPVDGIGGITQAITSSSMKYVVSFDLSNDSGSFSSVDFGGTTLLSGIGNQGYVSYSFTVFAAANPTLSFTFANAPAYYNLDNVSVIAVPEPASWAMLVAGFGLAGAAMRRRQAAVAA